MDFPSGQIAGFFCAFVYGSFFEWVLHKYLMHRPFWRYSFRAHAVVHHGLFRTGSAYFLSDPGHLRKIRFAWWNAPLIIVLHAPPILYLEHVIGFGVSVGAISAIGVYYSLYEYLHYCMHVPKARRVERSAWFLWLDSHHHMHHKRHFSNLNVVLPLADAVFGTLVPARERPDTPERKQGSADVAIVLS
jgi:hypothetical protein